MPTLRVALDSRVDEQSRMEIGNIQLCIVPNPMFGKLAFHPSFYSSSTPMFVMLATLSNCRGTRVRGCSIKLGRTEGFILSSQTPDELTSVARQLAYAWTIPSMYASIRPSEID